MWPIFREQCECVVICILVKFSKICSILEKVWVCSKTVHWYWDVLTYCCDTTGPFVKYHLYLHLNNYLDSLFLNLSFISTLSHKGSFSTTKSPHPLHSKFYYLKIHVQMHTRQSTSSKHLGIVGKTHWVIHSSLCIYTIFNSLKAQWGVTQWVWCCLTVFMKQVSFKQSALKHLRHAAAY